MIRYENCSTPCPKEMPCIHEACPHYRIKAYCCDKCKDDTPAVVEWEGEHFCESCLHEELDKAFSELSISEKIELLALDDEITEV